MRARTWLPANSVALIVVAVLVTAALSPLPVAADATPDTAVIRWEPCYDGTGLGYECATVAVPLDHDRPRGRTIELMLVRLPATDPDARIGSWRRSKGGRAAQYVMDGRTDAGRPLRGSGTARSHRVGSIGQVTPCHL